MPNGRITCRMRRSRDTRGFTLTEVAIVIGISAFVIGAIGATASVARYRIQLNQGVDEVNLIAGNMRGLYSGQPQTLATTAASAAFEQQLISENIFPQEMLFNLGGTTYAYNPWDQTTANGSAQVSLLAAAGGLPAQFDIKYFNVPPEACTDLLVRNSLPGPDTGLLKITVTETTGAAAPVSYAYNTVIAVPVYQLPVSSLKAAAACPDQVILGAVVVVANPLYNIEWFYNLGG